MKKKKPAKSRKNKKSLPKTKTKAKTRKKTGKFMVVVESPAKIKTLSRFLGPAYIFKACYGHFRDLPSNKFGLDIKKDFKPNYQIMKSRAKIVSELKKTARQVDIVFLASDPDREGEAIAWHLREILELPDEQIKRVAFNEITATAVRDAFKEPHEISKDMFEAQQTRRFLDRIVGYKLSPLLWKKIARGLSAGRVQSVAVKLVVEREKEIQDFKPREYWKITAELTGADQSSFQAELNRLNAHKFGSPSDEKSECWLGAEAEVKKLSGQLDQAEFIVSRVTVKESNQSPAPPFITSTLQQGASTQLGFSTKKTMLVAQQLYEGVDLPEGSTALITYMRTDSVRMSSSAMQECRKFVQGHYGAEYLHEKTRVFKSRKSAQEAHEAIRPTYVSKTPDSIQSYLTPEQYKLYRIIWNRFVATQMAAARWQSRSVVIEVNLDQPLSLGVFRRDEKSGQAVTDNISLQKCSFSASGRKLLFKGFLVLANPEEIALPSFKEQDKCSLVRIAPVQAFTQPPPRYNEASLVRTLEKHGIGRPSTYAPIISTIQDRGYVSRVGRSRQLQATELGILVTDKLVKFFRDIMDPGFTAQMEEKLDQIEAAKIKSLDVLKEYYELFAKDLAVATEEMTSEKGKESGQKCDKCGQPLVNRWSRYGSFLACSGYPKCKNIVTPKKEPPQETGEKCDKCGQPMVKRSGRRGDFIACSGFPKCRNTKSVDQTKDQPDNNSDSEKKD
ncbi:MAG: type I DNA topoisomerase [Planctomycetes bacterium]|nr:type I DNA topoisomerase [Planctomycetota bacterium]